MDIRWLARLTHLPLTRIDKRFNDFSLSSNCASFRAIMVARSKESLHDREILSTNQLIILHTIDDIVTVKAILVRRVLGNTRDGAMTMVLTHVSFPRATRHSSCHKTEH